MDYLKREAVSDFCQQIINGSSAAERDEILFYQDKLIEAFSKLPGIDEYAQPIYVVPKPVRIKKIAQAPVFPSPYISCELWQFVRMRWPNGQKEWVLHLS